jgi:hypothetical protein
VKQRWSSNFSLFTPIRINEVRLAIYAAVMSAVFATDILMASERFQRSGAVADPAGIAVAPAITVVYIIKFIQKLKKSSSPLQKGTRKGEESS